MVLYRPSLNRVVSATLVEHARDLLSSGRKRVKLDGSRIRLWYIYNLQTSNVRLSFQF